MFGTDKITPNEIPVKKNPDNTKPLKDPLAPSEDNPVNPKTDEPTDEVSDTYVRFRWGLL